MFFCFKSQVDSEEVQEEIPSGCMRKYFIRRGPRSRTKRSSRRGKKNGDEKKRNLNTLTRKEEILAMLRKMPKAPDLKEEMDKIVYHTPFSSVEHDILRLVRRIIVESRKNGTGVSEVSLSEESTKIPETLTDHLDRSCYLLKILLSLLVDHFEDEAVAVEYNEAMDKVFEGGEITVKALIDACGGEESKSAKVVKCLHQGVVITGVTYIKCQVCPLPTKDMAQTASGWGIKITLDDNIQVKQTRREVNVLKTDGDWEIQWDISLTFDRNMSELTNVRLTLTDLDTSQVTDNEIKQYLKEVFKEGELVMY